MIWLDVDGIRHYLAQGAGNRLPSRKSVYALVKAGLRVARAEMPGGGCKRGGSRIYSCPEWIDAFMESRSTNFGLRMVTPDDRRARDAG